MTLEDFERKSPEERGDLIARELELIDLQDALGDLDKLAVNVTEEDEDAAAEDPVFEGEGDDFDEE